jgi:hypothetical protein
MATKLKGTTEDRATARSERDLVRKEALDRHAVRIGKVRESLAIGGFRQIGEGKAGRCDLEIYANGRGVVIVEHLVDGDGVPQGVEVFAPIADGNSLDSTCAAIEGFVPPEPVKNRKMRETLESGECLDVRKEGRLANPADVLGEDSVDVTENCFILSRFVEDKDYCDALTESWIWSIGRSKKTGAIFASTSTRFYQNELFECLFLR